MPELVDQMYCSQQIVIPPKFPYTLKRYCKAAIKTQPYDLLRWSFEYFKALAENRRPPVKLRLEYPIYSSEGGLTRGCLKVLAHQLSGISEVPIPIVKRAWRGFCLDSLELVRILCLCEVYEREESVPFLHFIAVAGGLLTKCLTNTMILLCETLTKEPDGGSAAIPAKDFLKMYRFLASVDASADVKYFGGYREGHAPPVVEEEEAVSVETEVKYLRKLSAMHLEGGPPDEFQEKAKSKEAAKAKEDKKEAKPVQIFVFDEQGNSVEYQIYGEPESKEDDDDEGMPDQAEDLGEVEHEQKEIIKEETEAEKIDKFITKINVSRKERLLDLAQTIDELAAIVDKFNSASYDLGMVAGRQMSTTSGEFIVQHIERDIMAYIDEQIGILPDPDLKKKKAKPEEVEMVRGILEAFIDENMDLIIPEIEEVEEEEQPIPEITVVYAVPGIGPVVDPETVMDFVEYAREVSKEIEVIMPRHIRHYLCPPLEKYVEYYEKPEKEADDTNLKKGKHEEVSVGGVLAQ